MSDNNTTFSLNCSTYTNSEFINATARYKIIHLERGIESQSQREEKNFNNSHSFTLENLLSVENNFQHPKFCMESRSVLCLPLPFLPLSLSFFKNTGTAAGSKVGLQCALNRGGAFHFKNF